MKKLTCMLLLINGFICPSVYACTDSVDPATVVQAQLEAYNARNVELLASCFSDDVKIQDMWRDTPTIEGKQALKKAYKFLETMPDTFRVVLENRVVNGPIVIDHERIVGLGESKEDRLVFAIYEVRDGKITNIWFPPPE